MFSFVAPATDAPAPVASHGLINQFSAGPRRSRHAVPTYTQAAHRVARCVGLFYSR